MKCTKEACKECPFKRTSAAGYLGSASYDPQAFLAPHLQGDTPLPCHMTINWESDLGGARVYATKPLCRGFLIFLKNSCTLPRHYDIREALETVEADSENFFKWLPEFVQHHSEEKS